VSQLPTLAPPPGWYPDPWAQASYRWWSGLDWTPHVSLAPPQPGMLPLPTIEPEPTLPVRAGWIALGLLLALLIGVGLVVGIAIVALDSAGVDISGGFALLAGSVLLYGPMLWWCGYVSRRWGTGSLRADLGLQWRWADAAWAVAALLGAYVAMFTIMIATSLLGLPVGSNTEGLGDVGGDTFEVIALFATAAVAAPVVEEMFFRGLVLRAMRSRFALLPALLIQGTTFGIAHFSLGLGLGAISLLLALSAIGVIYGLVAWQTRRLGATIIAHALQNAIAVTLALLLGF